MHGDLDLDRNRARTGTGGREAMAGRILILGAAGRLGRVAAEAFRDAGWRVTSLVRPRSAASIAPGTALAAADARDRQAVIEAARGAELILHALNPPLTDWHSLALPLAYAAIDAAEATGATLMFPGNLYNYGPDMPEVIDEATPMRPASRKGQLRVIIEQRMQEAADRGVRTIVLRAGDFFGSGRGSWFDLVIAKDIVRGRITYPGPLDVLHEWAYLPDIAAAMVRLAQLRTQLAPFETFGFPGHAVTGHEFVMAMRRSVNRGFTVRPMSWWLIHALRPIMKVPRELSELASLWHRSHRIDGGKLLSTIGDVPRTPLDIAMAHALADFGLLPA
jgi:nucleoside-diphosphate-sugar epimerase